jgi:uncharacterized protein YndB with AHSA1/START domain
MPDIRHLIFIKSTPEKIYEALCTQKGIASWWSVHNNAKPEVGTIYRISFGGDYFKEIKVAELAANKSVVWEILQATTDWLNTKVTFTISIGQDSAELRFNHSGWKEYTDMFAQCNHHWGIFLQNLKIYCEKGKTFAAAEFF